MGRHRKKAKTKNDSATHHVDQNDSETHHDENPLPNDLVVEILERLPVRSLARSICVSKSWDTTIHSKAFIKSFALRSSLSHPSRLLFASKETNYNNGREDWYFCTSDFTSHTKFQVMNKRYNKVQQCYVHGLMSFLYGERHVIVNPSTGKSVTLPNVVSRRQVLNRFFGYDPVSGEHKVLCIVKATYGSGKCMAPNVESSLSHWRKIKCTSVPHTPIGEGVCINGVVYYFAYVGKDVLTLVRFDVRSEELSFVTSSFKLKDLKRPSFHLICYEGHLTLANLTSLDKFDLWVWKDYVKDEWLKTSLCVRTWSDMVPSHAVRILGTNKMGEVVVTHCDLDGGIYVVYHDPKKNTPRKAVIPPHNINQFGPPTCFMDYIDSVMLS